MNLPKKTRILRAVILRKKKLTLKTMIKSKSNQKDFRFCRVADLYYQMVEKQDPNPYSHQTISVLIQRKINELKSDGIQINDPNVVPRFVDFINYPSNIDYKRNIDNFFNLSYPSKIVPIEGEHPNIDNLLKHIFQDQYNLIMDYLTILWRDPLQILPIICIVSEIQHTGKTTFVNLMNMIFGQNAVTISSYEFSQKFNALYATSGVICIEESCFSDPAIKEKIKQLSTSYTIQYRNLFIGYKTIGFYGKFILTSNNELDFINLSPTDIRFWIVKPKKIETFDPSFHSKLESEIPQFVYTLTNRKIETPNDSRMWFDPSLLKNDALNNVIENSQSNCAKEIMITIGDIIGSNHEFKATLSEIYTLLDSKFSKNKIKNALTHELGYSVSEYPVAYSSLNVSNKKGRIYTFHHDDFIDSTTNNDTVPF